MPLARPLPAACLPLVNCRPVVRSGQSLGQKGRLTADKAGPNATSQAGSVSTAPSSRASRLVLCNGHLPEWRAIEARRQAMEQQRAMLAAQAQAAQARALCT